MPDEPSKCGSRPSSGAESRPHAMREEIKESLDRRIVRVFFSSPFRGMEIEREELTKKYWPRLSSMCSKAGYEFVPVDLRWGITSEMTENAGTLNVCLREVERSDMFVGFFGQRYGWHGDDKLLQKSFDAALPQYPWLDEYRDRSVTEIEFLHGHLRHPGNKPACFFFRDKAYDDTMQAEYEASNKEKEAEKYKSSTDGENAGKLLDDLKSRIVESKDKCLKVIESYSNPVEGAEYMFKTVEAYLQETVLASPAKDISDREKALQQHNAYYISRLGVGANHEYIGGDRYLKEVDRHVLPDVEGYQNKPLLVLGDPGFGKTTLLANWLFRHQKAYPEDIIAGHFVGCAPKSTGEKDVLIRLVIELTLGFAESFNDEKDMPGDTTGSDQEPKDNFGKDHVDSLPARLMKMDIYTVFKELQDILKTITENGKRAIIIIDALNKMDTIHQTKQELYWLPTELPDGISLLVSSLSNTKATQILLDERQYDKLDVKPLSIEDKENIIEEMLDLRGKKLQQEQTKRIIEKTQTENPLFLKIFLHDLCDFGDFDKLEDHLNDLLSANSTKELFMKVLEELETLVGPSNNFVFTVMSSILVSRYGLTEQEMKVIGNIPDHIWSMIYFTMDDFFIDRAGLQGFAYDELAAAVREKYCNDKETEALHINTVANYFQASLENYGDIFRKNVKVPRRIAEELPWLLSNLGDAEQMKKCLAHLGLFSSLFSTTDGTYDLYGYWNSLHLQGSEISGIYMKAVDKQVAYIYTDWLERYYEAKSPAKELLSVLHDVAGLLNDSGHPKHCVPVLKRALRLQKIAYTEEEISSDVHISQLYCETLNTLACTYCDLEYFDDSETLHRECLAIKEKMGDKWADSKSHMAITLNGLALVCQRLRKYDEAMNYYKQCLEAHRADLHEDHRLIGDTLNNIGSLLFNLRKFKDAIEYLDQAMKVYEVCYFGRFHHDVAGTLNNLAICYRNLNEMDKAGPLYERAYDMVVKALGEKHPDVAEKLMNWGVFHQYQENYLTALDMYERALQIYKEAFHDEHIQVLFVLENIAIVYVLMGRHEDAHPFFSEAGEVLQRQGRMDTSLAELNRRMLNFYIDDDRYDDIKKLLERMLDAKFARAENYIMLDKLDNMVVDEERPKRPYEHTVEYALTRFPLDEELVEYMKNRTTNDLHMEKHVIDAAESEGT